MNKLVKKNDELARKFLGDVTIAKEFLNIYLSSEIKQKCNLDTLTIESGSYIEDDLKAHYSDIVYKVNLKENEGSAYIYTLVEHQSSAKVLMPLRIIRYQLAIIQKHIDTYGKKSELPEKYKLPIVIPIVFYNGTQSPYPYACDIMELFADLDLSRQIQLGKFKLVDLTIINDEEILKHGKLAVLEMLAKHIHVRDFMSVIDVIISALQIGHDHHISNKLIDGAFSYLLNARNIDDIKELVLQINQNLPYYKETIMTYAEALRNEGMQLGKQEGIQLGKQEGMQLGKQNAKREIAKALLQAGVATDIIAQSTHLSIAEIKNLV